MGFMLVVLTNEVFNTTHRRSALEGRVASVVIGGMKALNEGFCLRCFTLGVTHVRPLFEHRAVESPDFVVGLRSKEPRSSILDQFAECISKRSTARARSVVAEYLSKNDSMSFEPCSDTVAKSTRRSLLLIRQDL